MKKTEQDELRKEWEQRIAVFKASGQTQAKWCAANEIKVHQLKYWLKRIEGSKANHSKENSKMEWIPIALNDSHEMQNETMIQIKIGSASIEVKHGFDPALLADVVKVLKHYAK